MPSFGITSRKKLSTCSTNIQLICNEGIKILDFGIITGHRTKEEQNALYPKYTKVKWPNGKHNSFPSKAVDVAPYIKPYGYIFGDNDQIKQMMLRNNVSKVEAYNFVLKSYGRLIGVLETIAKQNNIPIRLGIDWDGDFDMLDQSFHDLGHIEELDQDDD